jgi:hypothetical protein
MNFDVKKKVLGDISKWSDGMMFDRIKARKSPASLEIEAEGHAEDTASPEGMAAEVEEQARNPGESAGEGELSLEDLLALEKQHSEKC